MTLTETEVPQESDLRARLKEFEQRRGILMKAGFTTCTANGMLCCKAGAVKKAEGKDVLFCERRKIWIDQAISLACTKEQLTPA